MLRFLSGLCLLLLTLASCEKVIDLKVGDSTPQVVIEGIVTDDNRTASVRLTKTVSYTDSNSFPPITNARVAITDQTTGVTDTLFYTSNGYYSPQVALTQGQAGHTYYLSVDAEGQHYEATSTMPQPVPLDSIRIETSAALGRTAAQFFIIFTDPPGIPNYYRFVLQAAGKRVRTDVRDDRFSDGRINGRPIVVAYNNEDGVGSGTEVAIEMQGLDESTYKYFSTFGNADGNSLAPANPVTNIQGGAQGYFGAMTIQRRTVVLP